MQAALPALKAAEASSVVFFSPQFDCFTFSPSANLMPPGAFVNFSPSGPAPKRSLMTLFCPPMGLAEPCSRLAIVNPPASC